MSILAGTIYLTVGGQRMKCVGQFKYNLGQPKHEALVGPDGVHGMRQTAQVPFIEGEIRDSATLDLAAIMSARDQTVLLYLANGKKISLTGAYWAAAGDGDTGDAKIQARWEGRKAVELKS